MSKAEHQRIVSMILQAAKCGSLDADRARELLKELT